MTGMRTIASQFGKVPEAAIQGMRSPDLQNGGDLQFGMVKEDGFLYDSTMPTKAYGFVNMDEGLWPYSLDYKSTEDCEIPPCVFSSWPGVWEQPILEMEDSRDIWGTGVGEPCSYLGACQGFENPDPQELFDMLKKNFDRAYNGNRPPFGVHMDTAFFYPSQAWHWDGFIM